MKSKPVLFFVIAGTGVVLLTLYSIWSFTPETIRFSSADIVAFRRAKNQLLRSQVHAPFYQDASFDSLSYFPPDPNFVFNAEFYPVTNGESLDLMPDRVGYASHIVSGYLILELETWRDTLFVLKDLEEAADSIYFIPFTDPTNGTTTYGGGRYVDLILKPGQPARLDLNYAYNPYCAYKAEYVCPKNPPMNRLSMPVKAGEKIY